MNSNLLDCWNSSLMRMEVLLVHTGHDAEHCMTTSKTSMAHKTVLHVHINHEAWKLRPADDRREHSVGSTETRKPARNVPLSMSTTSEGRGFGSDGHILPATTPQGVSPIIGPGTLPLQTPGCLLASPAMSPTRVRTRLATKLPRPRQEGQPSRVGGPVAAHGGHVNDLVHARRFSQRAATGGSRV